MNIQQHYAQVAAGSRALAIANKLGQPHRSRAMAAYNRARARLRHAQNGTTPAKRYEPDFMATVNGIPCGVVVSHFEPGYPAFIRRSPGSGFGDAEPGKDPECDFFLVDRNGYRADWIKICSRERGLIEHYILNNWENNKCTA